MRTQRQMLNNKCQRASGTGGIFIWGIMGRVWVGIKKQMEMFGRILLVEHPASDHLQVFKHTQVTPLFWPSLNVQITCMFRADRITQILSQKSYSVLCNGFQYCSCKQKIDMEKNIIQFEFQFPPPP